MSLGRPVRAPNATTLSPSIQTLLLALVLAAFAWSACAAAPPAGQGPVRAYWVFFKDRGPAGAEPLDLQALADRYPPEAWARRAHGQGSAIPDLRDADLWPPYVEAISRLGRLRHHSRWLNAVSAGLDPRALDRVRALPFVEQVRPVAVGKAQSLGPAFDRFGRPLETTLPLRGAAPAGVYPYGPSQGQLQEIHVLEVHAQGYTANRVRMMMIDTGFRKDHHAFAHARLLAERDFVFHDGDTQNQSEDDPSQHFHGTGTWAVAGGYDPGHIVGPAYGASFVLSKTEDIRSETEVEEDNYVAALEWADSLGVQVTSASLSYTCFDDGFCYDFPLKDGHHSPISRALSIAAQRGILCANSAGNYGDAPRSLGTPADADSMLAVGAVDSLNRITWFSSRGPSDDGRTKPEVVARGLDTWWADAGGVSSYGPASGTSLSCPLVGGACALLFEAHPEWGPMDAREALMMTADKHTSPDDAYGWGRIHVLAAMNWRPVIYPKPFSLIAPADSATATTFAPTFSWRSSSDPDHGAVLDYSLWLRDASLGGHTWLVPAGNDTALALPFQLQPSTWYVWEVRAEDPDGHQRTSRERFALRTPGSSGVPLGTPADIAGWDVRILPNPSRGEVRFRLETGLGAAHAGEAAWALYDAAGRRMASSYLDAVGGSFHGSWDGRDVAGRAAPAGVYYLELRLADRMERRTLVRLAPDTQP